MRRPFNSTSVRLSGKTAQLDVRLTRTAAVVHLRVGSGAGDSRDSLEQVACCGYTGCLNRGRVQHEHGACRLAIDAADA